MSDERRRSPLALLRGRGGGMRDDSGNLMVLAGIIVTLAFIVSTMTLAQVSELERQAAAETSNPLQGEWRFLHERIGTNLRVAVSEETANDTYVHDVLPRIAATFRNIQGEKGYDTILRIARGGSGYPFSELDLVDGTRYVATTAAGDRTYSHDYDGVDDGIIWHPSCPTGSGSGCIVGVYIYLRIADTTSSIEETVLVRVN